MGLFGRLVGGKKKRAQGGAGIGEDGEQGSPMEVKRVEVPATPKMTKQEMVEELERNYREVLDLVRRMNDHLDREEERGGRMMQIAERVDHLMPAVGALAERVGEGQDRAADRIIESIETSERARLALAERIEGTLGDLHARIEAGGMTHERIASELDGLGSRVNELTQTNAVASEALRTIRDGATDRDTKFVTSIESARRSIVQAIWIGAAVVAVGLIVAAAIFASGAGSAGG